MYKSLPINKYLKTGFQKPWTNVSQIPQHNYRGFPIYLDRLRISWSRKEYSKKNTLRISIRAP